MLISIFTGCCFDCFPFLSNMQSSIKRLTNSLNSSKKLPVFPALNHLLILFLLKSPLPVRLCVINAVFLFSQLPHPFLPISPSHLFLCKFEETDYSAKKEKKSSNYFSCDSKNITAVLLENRCIIF